MRPGSIKARVLGKKGFGLGAGSKSIWQWLTSHAFVWQFTLQFTLVFALLSVVLVSLTGFGLSSYLAGSIKDSEIDDAAEQAEEHVSRLVMVHLSPGQAVTPLIGEQYAAFDSFVQTEIISADTTRVRLWGQDGTLLYSSDSPGQIGQNFSPSQKLATAFSGSTASQVADSPDDLGGPASVGSGSVLAVYAPLAFEGEADVAAAVEVHQAYGPIADRIENSQTVVYVAVAGALGFLYAVLLAIVGRGSSIMSRQRRQMMVRSQELKRSHDSLLQVLSAALDLRDRATKGHTLRLARLALAIGGELGFSDEALSHLERAAMLHDMTNLELPKAILGKAGPLTDDEWQKIQRHPELGCEMVRDAPFLREAGQIILGHHERHDGGGYPRGLKGEEIPLAARVFAVADTYDAMISDRPYRKAVSHATAVREIERSAGTQFDAKVVEAFLAADRKGLVEDKAFPREQGEEAAVADLVGQGTSGEEAHA
ncbi:MAG: HD-GYP domain-containing protein [Dehalococcoidia bacterium]|nr:MAG: HD-GYP domain-containing protein [Dehalococcoidia bacterium]